MLFRHMSVSSLLLLVFLGLLIDVLYGISSTSSQAIKIRPIHIGLSIDDHSLKDMAILINSVVQSAIEPSELVFHIVACGKDLMAAMQLKKDIASTMEACLPHVKHELVAFMLPTDSGFALQLGHLKKKSNHWNSQSGADMVRFYMPSLFAHIPRILYLDNDIIVSCCLEEVYDTHFEEHQIVGIALDSLAWATVTQFQRHYNASHPLVIQNMRRRTLPKQQGGDSSSTSDGSSSGNSEITTKEFQAALPRYPNDGVLLIDVTKYNTLHILETMNEIAQANGIGEYVVNLGTQQFTVLALWDRWKELTPRANLRHFPDMARGYLMWFYYNGFLHYAGQHKPKQLCLTTTSENAQGRVPYLRVMSYTAWALSNYQVHQQCPLDHVASVAQCLPHVHRADSVTDLYSMLHRIISVSPDSSLLYLHIGPLYGNYTTEVHRASSVYNMPVYTGPTNNNTRANSYTYTDTFISNGDTGTSSAGVSDSSRTGKSKNNKSSKHTTTTSTTATTSTNINNNDLIDTFLRIVLHNATWSVRVYDYKNGHTEHSSGLLSSAGFTLHDPNNKVVKSKKKGKKESVPRTISVQTKYFCDSTNSPYKITTNTTGNVNTLDTTPTHTNTTTTPATTTTPTTTTPTTTTTTTVDKPFTSCQSVLTEIKAEGRAHWDLQVVVVDVTPPQSFVPVHSSGSSSSDGGTSGSSGGSSNNSKKTTDTSSTHESLSRHSSLGVLLNLDLVFMRPKIVLVRLASTVFSIDSDSAIAHRFLKQNGYLTSQYSGVECGVTKQVRVYGTHHSHTDSSSNKNTASTTTTNTAPTTSTTTTAHSSTTHTATAHFVCVWGLRINEFEFYPNLLT